MKPTCEFLTVWRRFFAFANPDNMLDFHLNYIPWANYEEDSMPSLINYLKNPSGSLDMMRTVIKNLEGHISENKCKLLEEYKLKNKAAYDWLEQQREKFVGIYVETAFTDLCLRIVTAIRQNFPHTKEELKKLPHTNKHSEDLTKKL